MCYIIGAYLFLDDCFFDQSMIFINRELFLFVMQSYGSTLLGLVVLMCSVGEHIREKRVKFGEIPLCTFSSACDKHIAHELFILAHDISQ